MSWLRVDAVASAAAEGRRTAASWLAKTLARLAELGPARSGLATVLAARARSAAARVNAKIARGSVVGPLAGVTEVVKDNISVAGHTWTRCPATHRSGRARSVAEAAGATSMGYQHPSLVPFAGLPRFA